MKILKKIKKVLLRFIKIFIRVKFSQGDFVIKLLGIRIINKVYIPELDWDSLLSGSGAAATDKIILIKSPHTIKKIGGSDGELFLAEDLAAGFNKQKGYFAIVLAREYWSNAEINSRAFGSIFIRGYRKIPAAAVCETHKNIAWVIYNNKNRDFSKEMGKIDFIASGSMSYKMAGRDEIFYVPQFSNPVKFKNEVCEAPEFQHDILFVGNYNSHHFRKSVKYLLEKKIPFSLFGAKWEGIIDEKFINGQSIKNEDLNKHYSTAKINVCDHFPVMAENGFVANRIYDVTSCAGFLISDYMPEIEKTYGDSVPMYKNAEDLERLVKYYANKSAERAALAKKAQAITLANFTAEICAKKFIYIFQK